MYLVKYEGIKILLLYDIEEFYESLRFIYLVNKSTICVH